jgi:hypothetical protein
VAILHHNCRDWKRRRVVNFRYIEEMTKGGFFDKLWADKK